MAELLELHQTESEAEARGLEFTLRSVGLGARAVHVWEAGREPDWRWVVLVPREELARAREILEEELPGSGRRTRAADPAPRREPPGPDAPPRLYWVAGPALLNLLVFVAMEGRGGSESRATLLRFGASHAPSLLAGQWWRLVCAQFIHIGFKHLLGNLASLGLFSVPVLRAWGVGRFLALYLGSGLCGNLLSFAVSPSDAVKAGASGAILGLLGVLAGTRIQEIRRGGSERPSRYKTWHVLAMLLAYYGFVVGVGPADHLAHFGGLAAGVAGGLWLPRPGTLPRRTDRILGWSTGLAASGLVAISAALQALLGR